MEERKGKFKRYLERAENGDPIAQLMVSFLIKNGDGVDEDEQAANKWLLKSINNGNKIAKARQYLLGLEIEENPKKTLEILINYLQQEREEEEGMLGYFMLGYLYHVGKGVEKDYLKAVEFYQKAGDRGNFTALNNLADLYYRGLGVAKDIPKAIELYTKCAENGSLLGMSNLGKFYQSGTGVPENLETAAYYFRKAAEGGDAIAMNSLGIMVEQGKGVKRDIKQAIELFENASLKGNCYAMYNAGQIYYKGIDIPQDLDKAAFYFFNSFNKGHPNAKGSFMKLITNNKIEWKEEYHLYWISSPFVQKKHFFSKSLTVTLNNQILTLLLISKNRKLSHYDYVFSFVRGICINLIKFLCNYRQHIPSLQNN